MTSSPKRPIIAIVAVICVLSGCFAVGYSLNHRKSKGITLRIVKVDAKSENQMQQGYGYQIYVNDTLVIDQPFIPNTAKRPFQTKKDAEKVGKIVVDHMRTRGDISISTKELKSLGVL